MIATTHTIPKWIDEMVMAEFDSRIRVFDLSISLESKIGELLASYFIDHHLYPNFEFLFLEKMDFRAKIDSLYSIIKDKFIYSTLNKNEKRLIEIVDDKSIKILYFNVNTEKFFKIIHQIRDVRNIAAHQLKPAFGESIIRKPQRIKKYGEDVKISKEEFFVKGQFILNLLFVLLDDMEIMSKEGLVKYYKDNEELLKDLAIIIS